MLVGVVVSLRKNLMIKIDEIEFPVPFPSISAKSFVRQIVKYCLGEGLVLFD